MVWKHRVDHTHRGSRPCAATGTGSCERWDRHLGGGMTGQATNTLAEEVLVAAVKEGIDSDRVAWIEAAFSDEATWTKACQGPAPTWTGRPGEVSAGAELPKDSNYFIKEVEVQGFRGIGSTAVLRMPAQPGLIVVSGRNGSGKSSFAEGLEVALTGRSARLASKSGVWLSRWRNLHEQDSVHVAVRLMSPATGPNQQGSEVVIDVQWPPDAEITDGRVEVLINDHSAPTGRQQLDWDRAMEIFRPILTYEELGALLDGKPSELHDALHRALSLERLDEADRRLAAQVRAVSEPEERERKQRRQAKALAEGIADAEPRARQAKALLSARNTDREALQTLARGSDRPADDVIKELDAVIDWASRVINSETGVTDVVQRLRSWRGVSDSLAAQIEVDAHEQSELLRLALAWHARHDGSDTCPVCGNEGLNEEWRKGAQRTIEEGAERRRRMDEASKELAQAQQVARDLLAAAPTPPALTRIAGDERPWATQCSQAAQAWNALSAVTAPDGLADHIEQEYPRYVEAVRHAAAMATAERTSREDAWQPVADAIMAWAAAHRDAAETKPERDAVSGAHAWLRQKMHDIRNDRIRPLAEAAGRIWSDLRQESSVELGSVTLAGTSTQRRVDLRAKVDDESTEALAVMSQGELHALALSLFLPRASQRDSPFGFIVLDDPIQAMDPAKVEGFVAVMERLAEEHQVIVFSHDDRLPAAVRRRGVPARVYEVVRGQQSSVQVRLSSSPADRHLSDAKSMARDRDLPEGTLRRALPIVLRSAVESAAKVRFFDRALDEGITLAGCEDTWESRRLTADRLRLGLGLDQGAFELWLQQGSRRRALGVTTTAVHQGLSGDITGCIRAVEEVVRVLEDDPSRTRRDVGVQ